MTMEQWCTLAVILFAAVLAALVWSGKVRLDTLKWLDKALSGVKDMLPEDECSPIENLVFYAYYAVHAAEQLARNGSIVPQERLEQAKDIIEKLADADGVQLYSRDWDALDGLIEAEVNKMGHKPAWIEELIEKSEEQFGDPEQSEDPADDDTPVEEVTSGEAPVEDAAVEDVTAEEIPVEAPAEAPTMEDESL